MVTVTVLSGGASPEHDVSLRSGQAVAAALKAEGCEVKILDPSVVDIDGASGSDVVFPALHGAGGEDGVIQAQMEMLGMKFVGSDTRASALCFDKWRYREKITAAKLPMAKGAIVSIDTYRDRPPTKQPYVLKPIAGGSSIDTFIVRDPAKAPRDAIMKAFEKYSDMLIEQLIIGTELTVGVLGDKPLPVVEIIPPEHGEFDYQNKYNGTTQELVPPVHVSEDIQKRAQELALKTHKLTGCRDLSRTDIMLDNEGNLYLLETNTMPGMTDQSLFPKAAKAAGISMQDLCRQLVATAMNR